MKRNDRDIAFPAEMQGRWLIEDEPTSILSIVGGEVTCFGAPIEYDYKELEEIDGAITVSLKVDNEAQEDAFSRANITDLVITPDGEFLGYNVKFGVRFLREE